MLEQMWQIFIDQFQKYGIECLGYFIMSLCFGMFFLRSTQKQRFHWLGNGCRLLSLGAFALMVLPTLKILNPNFEISEQIYQWILFFFVSAGGAFLWSSLFVTDLGKKYLWILSLIFMVIQVIGFFILSQYMSISEKAAYFWLAFIWIIMGFVFLMFSAKGKTSFFATMGECFLLLSTYYIFRELGYIPQNGWLPMLLFTLISIWILMAQVKFMETTCTILETNLQKEKERHTLFWDIAPFPILVSKLMDDSVIYINPKARDVLKVSMGETSRFHLKDYFIDTAKRDELILATNQNKVVDGFEVQMKSPRTGETIWLDISSRVIELEGELALYMNLQDITTQKQTEEKLFKQAATDALTGLYNRRQFEAMCSMALASCIRQKTPYCMMMLDIDHFKNVNDTYGHDIGDIVLKRVADVLKQTHRDSDIVARYGGEEFIIFLNNTDINGAQIAAERIRSGVENLDIIISGQKVPVTISLGITGTQNGDIYAMTKEADIALYHSKEGGRNRYTVFSEEMREEKGANT